MISAILLDLVILAIIVVCAIMSAKHGFVRTVIEVVGFIAAFVIAFNISLPLAEFTYDKTIEPSILSKVESTTSATNEDISQKFWDALPGIFKNNFESFGISKENIDASISENVTQSAATISKQVTRPVITKILSLLYSTVIVSLLCVLAKFLAKIVNKAFTHSFVGRINSTLGGIVGIVKGIGVAIIFCMIISVLIVITKSGIWIFTPDNIDSSHLFKIFYGVSPFV